mmetsp:Transcript_6373/g.39764  ORF Transcript_6373/g.39764 Transcript_6373/m.39764 type:complete len:89 (-) Transcript_6373:658-924(-)
MQGRCGISADLMVVFVVSVPECLYAMQILEDTLCKVLQEQDKQFFEMVRSSISYNGSILSWSLLWLRCAALCGSTSLYHNIIELLPIK